MNVVTNFRWADDTWFGWDKLDHLAYGACAWLLLTPGTAWGWYGPFFQGVLFVVVAGAVEAIQLYRYLAWEEDIHEYEFAHSEGPPARPAQADLPSYKDLAWDAAGAIGCGFLLHLIR